MVVRGDDFTAIGTSPSLDLYETAMAKAFEVKLKGRSGHGANDMKEMRVLNRVLRVVATGLRYEPDPRHVELLVRALRLEGAKGRATPGDKPTYQNRKDANQDTDEYAELISSFKAHRKTTRSITFKDPEYFEGLPDPSLSRQKLLSGPIGSSTCINIDLSKHDAFTGLTLSEMQARRKRLLTIREQSYSTLITTRDDAFSETLLLKGRNGESKQALSLRRWHSTRNTSKKKVGARAAKFAERLADPVDVPTGEDATSYRALAARANYLALDRPDIAFASNELCRCFAHPTRSAVDLLKRLCRYLLLCPRLVWTFDHQKDTNALVCAVDTDFAGRLVTRRSTSGGVARRGAHLIKHWADTQPTVSLSSAEAELGGICGGASTGLGLVSIARDLGLNWTLHLETDASAAVGICRRRGLGKTMHLATSDLWVQENSNVVNSLSPKSQALTIRQIS